MGRLGVCVTGQQRSLLELPVVSTYHRHVLAPLKALFIVESLFAIVVKPNVSGAHDRLKAAVREAYGPVRAIELLLQADTEAWLREAPNPSCPIQSNRTWSNALGDHSVLLQWHAIARCFQAAEAAEAAGGWRCESSHEFELGICQMGFDRSRVRVMLGQTHGCFAREQISFTLQTCRFQPSHFIRAAPMSHPLE